MLRLLVFLTLAAVVAYFGSTVKLGERTFFGHIRAIWSTKEAQDMRKGLDEKAGPALDRMKRGVEAGIKAAGGDDGGAPTVDGGVPDAPADAVLPEAVPPPPSGDEQPAPASEPKEKDKAPAKKAKDKKDAKKPEKSASISAGAPLALSSRTASSALSSRVASSALSSRVASSQTAFSSPASAT